MQTTIIYLDDDEKMLNLFASLFNEKWNIITTTNKEDLYNKLEQRNHGEEISVVVSDYVLQDDLGTEVLNNISKIYPKIRRVLTSGHLDLDVVLASVNNFNIHKVVEKPWNYDNLLEVLEVEIGKFKFKTEQEEKINYYESQLNDIQEGEVKRRDEIIDLIINVTEQRELGELINQYISAIKGMQSLASLYAQLFLEKRHLKTFNQMNIYIDDIDVFSDQFDQKTLKMYTLILRCYNFLLLNEFDTALDHYKEVLSIYHWLANNYIDDELISAIKEFPLFEDTVYQIKQGQHFEFDKDEISSIKATIRNLLDLDLGKLISLSESLFQHFNFKSAIKYLIISKNGLPVYYLRVSEKSIEPSLISGFVVALSNFMEEVINAKGEIDIIKHQKGIILCHRYNDFDYLLLCSSDDLRFRIGLKQFAYSCHKYLKASQTNNYVEPEIEMKINEFVTQIFKLEGFFN